MSLMSLLRDAPGAGGRPVDVLWQRDARGFYPRLLAFDAEELGLTGVGGVYVLWHRGQSPRWIYIGASNDLGQSIERARDAEDVLTFETHGRIYVTWAPIKPEFRDGVVNYLRSTMEPLVTDTLESDVSNPSAEPIAVLSPS
jgi:hypothetical protein